MSGCFGAKGVDAIQYTIVNLIKNGNQRGVENVTRQNVIPNDGPISQSFILYSSIMFKKYRNYVVDVEPFNSV